ncbi:CHAT domain-containing protein [Actinotalea sp. K2]|uniref:CHAT domain-containing protein n=1 Tax=Actinotalea sp. K2 TaxID=2939438 RepID=UPI002017E8E3|nr:CHAT domain-containing protein [Actinotalea sp. K2]MCL3861246.1 CHAT domain-containing protein [Actinotalea sp. K2]
MDISNRAVGLLASAAVRALDRARRSVGPTVLAWEAELATVRERLGPAWSGLGLDEVEVPDGGGTQAPSDAVRFARRVAAVVSSSGSAAPRRGFPGLARRLVRLDDYDPTVRRVVWRRGLDVVAAATAPVGTPAGAQRYRAMTRDLLEVGRAAGLDPADLSATTRTALLRFVDERPPAAPPVRAPRWSDTVGERIGVIDGSVLDSVGLLPADRRTYRRIGGADGLLWTPRRAPRTARRRPSRAYVNAGFSPVEGPLAPTLDRLERDTTYWVWVGVGPQDPGALGGEREPVRPSSLADGEPIDVVLLPDAGLGLGESHSGRLRVVPGGPFEVDRPAEEPPPGAGDHPPRLYFMLRTPPDRGTWRIRCALMAHGVLLHVEQLTVVVGPSRRSNRARTTYRVVTDLGASAAYRTLRAPTLSVYANNGPGTHDFSFLLAGATEPLRTAQASLDAQDVITLTGLARRALGQVSWGSPGPYAPGSPNANAWSGSRFASPEVAARQLVDLAYAGRLLWSAFAQALDRDPDFVDQLREGMRRPGSVQLAVKENPSHVVPLQMLYDRRLDTTRRDDLTLCEASRSWLEQPTATLPCADGECPQEDAPLVVCAAGFWGYRHQVSLGLSNPSGSTSDLATVPSARPPRTVAAVATDPAVVASWGPHEVALRQWVDIARPLGTNAAEVLTAMGEEQPTIAYFLTHLVHVDQHPYLRVGTVGGIDAGVLQDSGLRLRARPLVFLNACESAGVSPERVLGLVDRFLAHGASAAVGTEVTVFVDLAARFGEAFLRRFAAGSPLAESMRAGRVEMLGLGNPLGLAYVSYGLHDLHLAPGGATHAGGGGAAVSA